MQAMVWVCPNFSTMGSTHCFSMVILDWFFSSYTLALRDILHSQHLSRSTFSKIIWLSSISNYLSQILYAPSIDLYASQV